MFRPTYLIVIISTAFLSLTTAQAEKIKGGIDLNTNRNSTQPLASKGILTIGGISGGIRSAPGARNCYGSTRCKDSGSYYSEEGIMNYKNGEPLVQRKSTQRAGSKPPRKAQ